MTRSIYSNPYKYAIECNVPFELAKIACAKQRHFEKDARKHRMYCPICKSKELVFEEGSYEEGYGDFIECQNCGETFNINEVPNSQYARLTGWEDFDAVLYYSCTKNKTAGWMEACGATSHEEWVEFAKKVIIGKKRKIQ